MWSEISKNKTDLLRSKVRDFLSKIADGLNKRDGLLFPAVQWALNKLFYYLSLGRCLNKESRAWVSELYVLIAVIVGLGWLALIHLPILTGKFWTVAGVIIALYRPLEIVLLALRWLLVERGPVESYRRSLVIFFVNLLEIAIFFAIAFLLVGSLDIGPYAALKRSLTAVFTLTLLNGLREGSLSNALAHFRVAAGWILVVLVIANVIGAISRGEKAPDSESNDIRKHDIRKRGYSNMNWLKSSWVFIVFLLLGILHVTKVFKIDGVALCLFILGGLPLLLPLIARYVESFKAGKEGVEAKLRQDATQAPQPIQPTPPAARGVTIPTYAQMSLDARRILKSLWTFQLSHFGEDSEKRWGFGVGSQAQDFLSYRLGVQELTQHRLIFVDARGISYLTNEGLEFCKGHRQEIEAEELYYRNFAAA